MRVGAATARTPPLLPAGVLHVLFGTLQPARWMDTKMSLSTRCPSRCVCVCVCLTQGCCVGTLGGNGERDDEVRS